MNNNTLTFIYKYCNIQKNKTEYMKILVMFPDYKGQVITGPVGEKLLELQKNSKHEISFLSILNGGEKEEMEKILNLPTHPFFHKTFCKEKGLTHALLHGYAWVMENRLNQEHIVVRFDPDEHPIEDIEYIARVTNIQNYGRPTISVWEFKLDKEIASEAEILVNENIFPHMYKTYTDGKVSLTNTHGFQCFAPGTISKILPLAKKIVESTEEYTGETLMWGMDAIMILSAAYSPDYLRIVKRKIRPEKIRDRPIAKIGKQIENHALLLMIGRKILK